MEENWRPDGWEETTFNLGFAMPYKATDGRLLAFSDGVEAGADAMLKALKPLILEIAPASRLVDILYKEK